MLFSSGVQIISIDNEDQVNAHFGRAEIVFVSGFEPLAAVVTGILVVIEPYVSDAYGGFQAPFAGEHPLVTVTHAPADIGAVVTVILAVFGQPEREFDFGDVVFSAETVYAEEMPVESFAEPITEFRLYQPVFEYFAA